MVLDYSLAVVFITFLLSWDLYVCPQTLALVSACSRNSALIRTLVFMCWCKLCFYSQAVEHLMMKSEHQIKSDKKKKTWKDKKPRKRLLLWLVWCVIIVVLSTPAIFYQVVKSIPSSLQIGKICLLGLRACIGAIQGLVGNFIVPYIASKMTRQKHIFTAVSNLVVSCLIPAVLIMYLDTGCLSRWVTLWKPCQSKSRLFQRRFICTGENHQDCLVNDHQLSYFDIMVLRSSDVCDPHFSWSSTSMSWCIHITLLRLQEVWLTKFIATGAGDARLGPHVGQLAHGIWRSRGQFWDLHGLRIGELGPSAIDECHPSYCLLM